MLRASAKASLMPVIACFAVLAHAQMVKPVVDLPTRPEVTQRLLVLTPEVPQTATETRWRPT